jgi:hypothetical protein
MGPFLAPYTASWRTQLITFSYLGAVSHLEALLYPGAVRERHGAFEGTVVSKTRLKTRKFSRAAQ